MKKINKALKTIFNILITTSLSTMVILVFINAVLRYGFHSSIPESEELTRYFFIWTSFLGMIAALISDQHVGVDIFVKKLKGRAKLIIEVIKTILMIIAFGVMFKGGLSYLEIVKGTKGPATGFPMEVIAFSIIFASLVMSFVILNKLKNNFKNNSEGE